MLRVVLGVIVGYAVWTAIWLGGNALLFGDAVRVVEGGGALDDPGTLVGILGLSIACSVAAGLTVATLACGRSRGAALVMAVLLLVTGIGVQASAWEQMPVWYHLAFLALIVPTVMVAARVRGPGHAAAVA